MSALVAGVFICAATTQPAAAQYTSRQAVFGPLMKALALSYAQWLSGPLKGVTPNPSAFTVKLSATSSPYTVVFAATKGHTLPGGSYSIPSSQVINPKWIAPPPSRQYSKGPFTLSGLYVRAYIAALTAHHGIEKSYGDAWAYQDSPGSVVVISALYQDTSHLIVGFGQTYVPAKPPKHPIVGCYKEQQYLVAISNFSAAKTPIGCPG
ncbi:MAG: hypothetical protein JO060_10380 [Candidatus Eremiobacteraeota bacterium]|nr:hypothetical protein [Candidatus Eremiobacteraeota bacterium]